MVVGRRGPAGTPGLPGVNAVPADSAVGTYVGTDGTNSAAAVDARVKNALPFTTPKMFGAKADGTDDQAAIQAAIDAMQAKGGGTVILGDKHSWKNLITVKSGVILHGPSNRQNLGPTDTPSMPGLVALDGTAQLRVGDWASSTSSAPAGVKNLYVDGNYVGATSTAKSGLVRIAGVNLTVENLNCHRSGADGIVYDGTQNSTILGCTSTFHVGSAVVLDNGPGALAFQGGYYGTSKGGALTCRNTAGEGDAYFFGPTQCVFDGTIFEAYSGEAAPIAEPNDHHVHVSGRALVFMGCNFTGGANNSANATVLIDNTVSGIPTTATFVSCLWWVHPSHDAVRIVGSPSVSFIGQQEVGDNGTSHALSFVCVDGGFPHVNIDGEVIMAQNVNGSNYFRTINSGSLVQCFTQRDVGTIHRLRVGQTVGFRREGDTQPRGTIDRDFGHGWYTDAGVPTASLTRGTAGTGLDLALGGPMTVHGDEIVSQFGLNTTGRRTVGAANWVFAGTGTQTFDASVQSTWRVTWSAGGATTFAFTGAADGRVLTLTLYAAVPPSSITWPSTVVWGPAGPPTLVANQPTTVRFRYDATFSQWLQIADTRSAAVTSVNGNTGAVTVEPTVAAGTTSQYYRGDKSWQTLDKTAVGLANVDNTSDANKPVSTAQATSIATRQPKIVTGTSNDSIFTVARTVTISSYTPAVGDVLALTLASGALANSPTLSVNGGSAVPITIAGAAAVVEECAMGNGGIWFLFYTGTQWVLMGAQNNWTTATAAQMRAGTDTTQRWVTPALVKTAAANEQLNTQTGATYSFVVGDIGKRVEGNSASAQTFTVPTGIGTAGDRIRVEQYGAGQITIAAGSGMTMRSRGSLTKTNGQYAVGEIYFRTATEFVWSGDIA
jgi:hypothetical protein